eukprot:16222438-Heterocapsa_arctica.AAC.1
MIRESGGPAAPDQDRASPWWHITTYIQEVAGHYGLDDDGEAEANSFFELLASKTDALHAQN